MGADALSRRPDYKNPDKFIKPMLVRNGNYMQVAETTEKNNDIIKKVHDTRLAGHQGIFKTLKRIQEKTTWKGIKADVEKYIKNCPTCAIGKHDRIRREDCTNHCSHQKYLSRNLHSILSLGYRSHKTQQPEYFMI